MIREVREEELPKLLELYEQLHDEDEPLPDENAVAAVWAEIFQNPRIHYWVIEEAGVWISSCHLLIVPNLTRGANPFGLIENVVTRRNCRGKGYGKRLLEHVLEQAWLVGCYKVMLMTGRKDEAVYRFYESVGFDRDAKQAFIAKPEGAR